MTRGTPLPGEILRLATNQGTPPRQQQTCRCESSCLPAVTAPRSKAGPSGQGRGRHLRLRQLPGRNTPGRPHQDTRGQVRLRRYRHGPRPRNQDRRHHRLLGMAALVPPRTDGHCEHRDHHEQDRHDGLPGNHELSVFQNHPPRKTRVERGPRAAIGHRTSVKRCSQWSRTSFRPGLKSGLGWLVRTALVSTLRRCPG